MKIAASLIVGLVSAAADPTCKKECISSFFRAVFKCEQAHENGGDEEEYEQCSIEAFRQFWSVCLGSTCGAIMPDGSCDAECTPTLEEQIMACDEQLASGEINAIGHYMCVMGPGGPAEQFETCFATCMGFSR